MITASIVLYKPERTSLSGLLDSCSNSKGASVSVCIVDNSPTDVLRPIVEEHGFVYMHRPDNPGFGASHNYAFAHVGQSSRYHFIINPDVKFNADVLAALVDYMDANSDVGLVTPRVIYPDGTIQFNRTLLPTPVNLILRRFFRRSDLAEELNTRFELRFLGCAKIVEIPALSGCFMLVRSSVYREIGGFDERFFMYFEDSDLTRRIGMKAKTVYYPWVTIIHEHGRRSYKLNSVFVAHIISAIRYFNKWGWFFDRQRDAINKKTLVELMDAK